MWSDGELGLGSKKYLQKCVTYFEEFGFSYFFVLRVCFMTLGYN